jgi:hypothetical protein
LDYKQWLLFRLHAIIIYPKELKRSVIKSEPDRLNKHSAPHAERVGEQRARWNFSNCLLQAAMDMRGEWIA